MVFLLTITLLWSTNLVAGKRSTDVTSDFTRSPLSTSVTQLIIAPRGCSLDRQRLIAHNISVLPDQGHYQHNDTVVFSCQSGYYLQPPTIAVFFNNTCMSGQWIYRSSTMPRCYPSCQEWNITSSRWQNIKISDKDGSGSGFIYSPGYPGNIELGARNCTFFFDGTGTIIRLVPVTLQLINYVLVIDSDQGRFQWPIANVTNGIHELRGLRKVTIYLYRTSMHHNNIGKAENFKVLYHIEKIVCHIFPLPDQVMVNSSNSHGDRMIQWYQCRYPYTLIGPLERSCLSGSWHPLGVPRCEFLCGTDTKVRINGSVTIKVTMLAMIKCRIRLLSPKDASTINIRFKVLSASKRSFCFSVKSPHNNVPCARSGPRSFYVALPATITYPDNQISPVETDMVEITIEMRANIFCPSLVPHIHNGEFIFSDRRSFFSTGEVNCLPEYYWLGAPKIPCVLDDSGRARWDFGTSAKCEKICSDRTESFTIGNDPIAILLPLFLRRDISIGQICNWRIMSLYHNPIIEITSMQDMRNFTNVSVSFQDPKTQSQVSLNRKFMSGERSFKAIFLCPDRICVLKIRPLRYVQDIPREISANITVKFDDKEGHHDSSSSTWVLLLVMLLLTVLVSVVLVLDHWRHPYTGYTAKLTTFFKKSQLQKLSAMFLFEVKPCKDYSKTQADIIVFYNRFHPDSRAVCIRRSFPSIDSSDAPGMSWKYRFSSVRRRFSDITDMVMYACTVRAPINKGEDPPVEAEEAASTSQ